MAIDRGIANFGATSDGDMIANPRNLEASLKTSRSRTTHRQPTEEGIEEPREGQGPRRSHPPQGEATTRPLPARPVGTTRQEPRRRRSGEAERRGHDPRSLRAQHRGCGMVPLRGDAPLQARVERGDSSSRCPPPTRARRAARAAASTRLRAVAIRLPLHSLATMRPCRPQRCEDSAARANRSGMPGDGTALKAAGRSRKRIGLRVPRRPPESSAL